MTKDLWGLDTWKLNDFSLKELRAEIARREKPAKSKFDKPAPKKPKAPTAKPEKVQVVGLSSRHKYDVGNGYALSQLLDDAKDVWSSDPRSDHCPATADNIFVMIETEYNYSSSQEWLYVYIRYEMPEAQWQAVLENRRVEQLEYEQAMEVYRSEKAQYDHDKAVWKAEQAAKQETSK